MLLAQSTTFIIGPIAKILGYIINTIHNGLAAIGIQNVAISIILFTIFIQILMIPLKFKSQKFQRLSSLVQPEVSAIREKYKGKKDQRSVQLMQQETNEVYKKYGASPTGGCLPMLVQMPILFALYDVIRNIPSYVDSINSLYLQVAGKLNTDAGVEVLKGIKDVTGVALKASDKGSIVDYLYGFNMADWTSLLDKVKDIPSDLVDKITQMSRIFGDVLISDQPWSLIKANGYIHWIWILPILVYVTSWLSMKSAQSKNQPQGPGSSQMKTMTLVMPIMSVFFSIVLPVGLGIYWIINSVLMTIQQIAMNKYLDKIGIEEMVKKNIEKNKNKQQKAKVKEGINAGSLTRAAGMSTKKMNTADIEKPEEKNQQADTKTGMNRMNSLVDKYKDK